MSKRREALRLEIDPVIASAEQLAGRVAVELPTHQGLIRAAHRVAGAAHEAKRVARRLRRPWGIHRLPAAFLALALVLLAAWIYWRFFHVSELSVALPSRDAIDLHQRVSELARVRFKQFETNGSRENAELIEAGDVDLAFIQGGIPFSNDLPRLETPSSEVALLWLRNGIEGPHAVRTLLTSVENQGSHAVAKQFAQLWGNAETIEYVHEWQKLVEDRDYTIPPNVDAVFAIKDLGSDSAFQAARKLAQADFQLVSPNLGARALSLKYLRERTIPAAYLLGNPPMPREPLISYEVVTYLVARRGLTPRLLASAAHLIDPATNTITAQGFEPTVKEAGNLLQGVEAFLGIIVYIGLVFQALLGLEIAMYRKRFNELNTLISLISMHQSNKDVLGIDDDSRLQENLLYLGLCSDLLGLIGVITGYYAQENASLLYNKMLEIIHHRCSGLKLNIQLKVLHAAIDTTPSDGLHGAQSSSDANLSPQPEV